MYCFTEGSLSDIFKTGFPAPIKKNQNLMSDTARVLQSLLGLQVAKITVY